MDPDAIDADDSFQRTDDSSFRVEWFSGTGKGGQHRNKKQTSCRVIHIPTGLVEARQGRKRESNLREAKEALIQRLANKEQSSIDSQAKALKKSQVGSGMRGDKIRTYRFQDDQVVDHQTGKTARVTKVMKGKFNLLW